MKVCVATMTSPKRKGLSFTFENMSMYAKKHGYAIHLIMVEDDKWEYKKHEAFKYLFELGYDLIWYRDDDLLITNLSVPIEDFIDDEHDCFITKDFNEINGGSSIWKNTEIARMVNDLIIYQKKDFENEQNVYNFWFKYLHQSVVKYLPQSTINSYDYSLYPECKDYVGREDLGDFVEGKSFVLHVPALPLEKRIEILKNTPIIK